MNDRPCVRMREGKTNYSGCLCELMRNNEFVLRVNMGRCK
jgi:hypothetical protein